MKPQRLLLISKQFWPLSGETELLAAAFARQLEGVVESVEVVTWRMIRQWPERFRWETVMLCVYRKTKNPIGLQPTSGITDEIVGIEVYNDGWEVR